MEGNTTGHGHYSETRQGLNLAELAFRFNNRKEQNMFDMVLQQA